MHRMTLIVINGLNLRLDLFRHLETRPSSFYDRLRSAAHDPVTNDVEALYELLGSAPSWANLYRSLSLAVMLAIDVQLTLILLLALPILALVTALFRRKTRFCFVKPARRFPV